MYGALYYHLGIHKHSPTDQAIRTKHQIALLKHGLPRVFLYLHTLGIPLHACIDGIRHHILRFGWHTALDMLHPGGRAGFSWDLVCMVDGCSPHV